MSPSPNPKTMPEVAAVAPAGDAAVPHLPEDGMKRLKTLMTDLLAEAENVGFGEKLGCRFPVNSADFWLCLSKFCGEADRGRLAGQRREFKIHRKSTAQ